LHDNVFQYVDNTALLSRNNTIENLFTNKWIVCDGWYRMYQKVLYKYYTHLLLRVDSSIDTHLKFLPTYTNEYSIRRQEREKSDFENKKVFMYSLLVCNACIVLCFGGFVYYWFKKKENHGKRYPAPGGRLGHRAFDKERGLVFSTRPSKERGKIDIQTFKYLKRKFKEFEKSKGFLENGITAGRLAIRFGTNATYISQIMTEKKEKNFNSYINRLRITYATQQIGSNKKWGKYTIEDIALICGFGSRQRFSTCFYKQNGIRVSDFIRKKSANVEA